MTLTVAIIIGLCGLGLLVVGMRGRRVDDHPVCRACRFDLFNLPQQRSACPECGWDIAQPRGTIRGNRRRNPRAVALGGLLFLFGSGMVTVMLWASAAQFNWNTIKPTWLLLREAQSSSATRADAAAVELLNRFANDWMPHQVHELVEMTLARHSDPEAHWSGTWMSMLETIVAQDVMSDDQLQRFIRQAVEVEVDVQERVYVGQPIEYGLSSRSPRATFMCPYQLHLSLPSITLASEPRRAGGRAMLMLCSSGPGRVGSTISHDLSPGLHDVHIAWDVTGVDTRDGREITSWSIEFETEVEIAPWNEGDVVLVTDESLRSSIAQHIRSRKAWLGPEPGRVLPQGMIEFCALPIDVAFEVIWRVGDNEISAGTVQQERHGGDRQRQSMGYNIAAVEGVDFSEVTHITIILRPSIEAAKRFGTVTEIWGEELVFEDVPLHPAGEYPPYDAAEAQWWRAPIEP